MGTRRAGWKPERPLGEVGCPGCKQVCERGLPATCKVCRTPWYVSVSRTCGHAGLVEIRDGVARCPECGAEAPVVLRTGEKRGRRRGRGDALFQRACRLRRQWLPGAPGVPDPTTSGIRASYYLLCDSPGQLLAAFWLERGRLRFVGCGIP